MSQNNSILEQMRDYSLKCNKPRMMPAKFRSPGMHTPILDVDGFEAYNPASYSEESVSDVIKLTS